MARIDGLLSIVVQQGADELRLATDREPRMFAASVPKRLTVPATSEETLRTLLAREGPVASLSSTSCVSTGPSPP